MRTITDVALEPDPSDPLEEAAIQSDAGSAKLQQRLDDVAKLQLALPDLRKNKLTQQFEYGSVTNPVILEGDDIETMTVQLAVDDGIYIPEHRLEAALKFVAKRAAYCPIERFLLDCEYSGGDFEDWDNLGALLLGRDDPFVTSILQRFFIGSVARATNPGCAMPWIPIFVGRQGCGKSQLIKSFVPDDLYAEICLPLSILMKEMYRLHISWITELPEVDSYFKPQVIEDFKNMITICRDEVRFPYASLPTKLQRHFVMAGTSNQCEFLIDETGNRRFIPLEIRDGFETPWRELPNFRKAMWKRAIQEFRKGTSYIILNDELEAKDDYMKSFAQVDPWEEIIEMFLETKEEVRTDDVLVQGLGFQPQNLTKSDAKRAGRVMSKLGWRRMVTKRDGKSVRLWKRSKATESERRNKLNDF